MFMNSCLSERALDLLKTHNTNLNPKLYGQVCIWLYENVHVSSKDNTFFFLSMQYKLHLLIWRPHCHICILIVHPNMIMHSLSGH